jgi:hypothetical protein
MYTPFLRTNTHAHASKTHTHTHTCSYTHIGAGICIRTCICMTLAHMLTRAYNTVTHTYSTVTHAPSPTHTHVSTRTDRHTLVRRMLIVPKHETHKHTSTHTRTAHKHTYTHTFACLLNHTWTARTKIRIHTHDVIAQLTRVYTPVPTHSCTPTLVHNTYIYVHTYTYTCLQAHTHTTACIHSRLHTHTFARMLASREYIQHSFMSQIRKHTPTPT